MLKSLAIAAVVAFGSVTTSASAFTVYDAFTSFNGVNGHGNFTYGSFASATTTFTPFTNDNGCSSLISSVVCLGQLPGAFKTTAGAHQSGSVIVPDDRLILHPGNGDDAAYVEFTASVFGEYLLAADFTVQDNNPSGVDLSFFYKVGGVVQFINPIGSLGSANSDIPYFNGGPLAVGDSVGIIIDKQGSYFNDSTGVSLTLANTSVPEPAAWSLLIAGFAMTGFAMRRRTVALTA